MFMCENRYATGAKNSRQQKKRVHITVLTSPAPLKAPARIICIKSKTTNVLIIINTGDAKFVNLFLGSNKPMK